MFEFESNIFWPETLIQFNRLIGLTNVARTIYLRTQRDHQAYTEFQPFLKKSGDTSQRPQRYKAMKKSFLSQYYTDLD